MPVLYSSETAQSTRDEKIDPDLAEVFAKRSPGQPAN